MFLLILLLCCTNENKIQNYNEALIESNQYQINNWANIALKNDLGDYQKNDDKETLNTCAGYLFIHLFNQS